MLDVEQCHAKRRPRLIGHKRQKQRERDPPQKKDWESLRDEYVEVKGSGMERMRVLVGEKAPVAYTWEPQRGEEVPSGEEERAGRGAKGRSRWESAHRYVVRRRAVLTCTPKQGC